MRTNLPEPEKRLFVLLRYLLVAAAAYLFLFEGHADSPGAITLLIAAALLSNVVLSRVPESLLLRPLTLGLILCVDVAWIAAGLFYKGAFGSDIFFLYFLVLFIAATGQNLLLIIGVSVLLAVVDLVLFVESGSASIWTSASLIRVPFMFSVALFYGHLADRVRKEHDRTLTEKRFAERMAGIVEAQTGELRQQADELHESYERLKKQAAELERANKAKDEFLSIVSHELRTPANVIMGYVEMVKKGMLGEINEQQDRALEKAIHHSKGLLSLITDILETTSIQSGAAVVEAHAINLQEFMEDLSAVYDVAHKKDLTLRWSCEAGLPPVNTDSRRLRHILQNLIHNAVKFTEAGSVSTTVHYAPATERVEFKVADTGIGMGEEALPYIFEMFRQLDSSKTRSHEGVGLGLYIAKKYADLLGATLAVESEVGRGSTFTLSLPLKMPENHSVGHSPAVRAPERPKLSSNPVPNGLR